MRRVTAINAVAALLLATGYAPLFHVHEGHDEEAALIHAHLPEAEPAEEEGERHLEPDHAEGAERSIDIFTTTAPQAVHVDAIVLSSYAVPNPGKTCCGFVPGAAPRAHAPPGVDSRIPRAPPA